MQWTNTGAVKGALHFHRPISRSRAAERIALVLSASQ